eukprot:6481224-Amphidinium_carterae.1
MPLSVAVIWGMFLEAGGSRNVQQKAFQRLVGPAFSATSLSRLVWDSETSNFITLGSRESLAGSRPNAAAQAPCH